MKEKMFEEMTEKSLSSWAKVSTLTGKRVELMEKEETTEKTLTSWANLALKVSTLFPEELRW